MGGAIFDPSKDQTVAPRNQFIITVISFNYSLVLFIFKGWECHIGQIWWIVGHIMKKLL